jgi:hypothetical protein
MIFKLLLTSILLVINSVTAAWQRRYTTRQTQNLKRLTGDQNNSLFIDQSIAKNTNFTKDDHIALVSDLSDKSTAAGVDVCSIAIDNLPAQSFGLDEFLALNNLPIRVLIRAMTSHHFECVFVILTEIQDTLRTEAAKTMIGVRCPKFVRTRWFYLGLHSQEYRRRHGIPYSCAT